MRALILAGALLLGAVAVGAEKATPLTVKDKFLSQAEAGLSDQRKGDWGASVKELEAALAWSEALEPSSISRGVVSMIEDERRLAYKPSPAERMLLHAFALISHARLGSAEGLGVEARRVDGWAAYCAQDKDHAWALRLAFARYLSAWAHEEEGELSDALIEIRGARKAGLQSGSPTAQVDADLLRLALPHDGELWPEEKPAQARGEALATAKPRKKDEGDLVLIFFRGSLPGKQSQHKGATIVGVYQKVEALERWNGELLVDGNPVGKLELVDDVAALLDDEARHNQALEYARSALRETAKTAAAITVKVAAGMAGVQINGNMEQDEADLRTWKSLPAEIYIGRARATAGVHDVVVQLLGEDGSPGPRRVLADQVFKAGHTELYTRWFN